MCICRSVAFTSVFCCPWLLWKFFVSRDQISEKKLVALNVCLTMFILVSCSRKPLFMRACLALNSANILHRKVKKFFVDRWLLVLKNLWTESCSHCICGCGNLVPILQAHESAEKPIHTRCATRCYTLQTWIAVHEQHDVVLIQTAFLHPAILVTVFGHRKRKDSAEDIPAEFSWK